MSSPKNATQPVVELIILLTTFPSHLPSIYYFLGFVYKIIILCAQNGSPKMSTLTYYFLDFDMGYCKILYIVINFKLVC